MSWGLFLTEALRAYLAWKQGASEKEALELELLRAKVAKERPLTALEVGFPQAVALMGALTVVVGGQHTGKSTLCGAVGREWLKSGRPVLWVESGDSLKRSQRPPGCDLCERIPEDLPKGCDLVLDDAWLWVEPGKGGEAMPWLRRRFHAGRRVLLNVQSARFVAPAVLASGAVQLVHTGYEDVSAGLMEREELSETTRTLAALALPRARAAMSCAAGVVAFRYQSS